jgi:hypothetical protein
VEQTRRAKAAYSVVPFGAFWAKCALRTRYFRRSHHK